MTFSEGDFFPYGVQYHRAPTPLPDEWAGDLAEIARCGYTHVQFRPQWRWHERLRGHQVWDDLDKLFDLAAQNRLRVILKPMLETAPDWVFDELNGTRLGFHGVPIEPLAHAAYYVGGWWPCFDNPGVVEAASAFVNALVTRYREHPALWFYDAWNEPRSRPLGQCHCRYSQQAYRDWLEQRFGTIEEFNNRFGKAWTSYASVRPPVSHSDYHELFLWRQWAADSVANQVDFVANAIRSAHPQAFVMVHVGASSVVQDPACDTCDDLLNARSVDRYGTSFPVPHHPSTPTEHNEPEYQSSWIRRVDPLYWCHEFYPSHAGWTNPPSQQTLARQIWMAIAGGATGFTYWQYRSERFGEESNGFGLREINGAPTPRSEVADSIAAVLTRHGRKLALSKRIPAKVKLLYSRENDLLMRIQTMSSSLGNINTIAGDTNYSYKQALRRAHLLYRTCGQEVDFVVPGDAVSPDSILHLTVIEMVDAGTAQWLREFVSKGGMLIVEYPFACRDKRTWVTPDRPAHDLEDLLGCREGNRVAIGPDKKQVAEFADGLNIAAEGWRVTLDPLRGEVIGQWQDGQPAAVSNSYGKGQVITLGINVSLAFNDQSWPHQCIELLNQFLTERGLETEYTSGLWITDRIYEEGLIRFIFNVSNESVSWPLPAKSRKTWHSMAVKEDDRSIFLEPGGCWVGECSVNKAGRT